jgi:hypothetical protein
VACAGKPFYNSKDVTGHSCKSFSFLLDAYSMALWFNPFLIGRPCKCVLAPFSDSNHMFSILLNEKIYMKFVQRVSSRPIVLLSVLTGRVLMAVRQESVPFADSCCNTFSISISRFALNLNTFWFIIALQHVSV